MPAALVTGSSRGIGRAIARRFADDGYDVAVNYHTSDAAAERVAETIRDRGRAAVVVGADVSEADAAARLVDAAVDASAASTTSSTTPGSTNTCTPRTWTRPTSTG